MTDQTTLTFEQRCDRLGRDPDAVRVAAHDVSMTPSDYVEMLDQNAARTPAQRLDDVSERLGLHGDDRLTAFEAESGDGAGFTFVGNRGRSRATARAIHEYRNARGNIIEATGVCPAELKAADWRGLLRELLQIATPIDLGPEATDAGLARAWLSEYLTDRRLVDNVDDAMDEVTRTGQPYRDHDGTVVIFGPALQQWLWTSKGYRITPRELGRTLAAAGCTNAVIHVTVYGKRTTRSTWRLPADLDPEGGPRG